jgi:hypothetical protein
VQAVVTPDGEELVAHCALSAERLLPGHDAPQRTVHFTGRVRLNTAAPAPEEASVRMEPSGATMSAEQVYAFYFHGPAYQVVAAAWRADDAAVATLTDPLPDDHLPATLPLATAPRLVELCFQTAGLWQAGLEDRLALPMQVASARLIADPATAEGVVHAVAHEVATGVFDCLVIDGAGTVIVRLTGYRTVPLPAPIPDDVASNLHATFRL